MSETEWLTCKDAAVMLAFLKGTASERKLMLFACACCRRIWHLTEDAGDKQAAELRRAWRAIEVTEHFAEGVATEEQLADACLEACLSVDALDWWEAWDHSSTPAQIFAAGAAYFAACSAGELVEPMSPSCESIHDNDGSYFSHAAYAAHVSALACAGHYDLDVPDYRRHYDAERVAQCDLLRELFGNPFRPAPPLALGWLGRQERIVFPFAEAAHQERAFKRLPILADALEDAGCTWSDLLDHLRNGERHVPGCWALDFVRGVA